MHSLRLGQSLAVAVALSLTLLIVGVIGLGVGIRHGDVMPDSISSRIPPTRSSAGPICPAQAHLVRITMWSGCSARPRQIIRVKPGAGYSPCRCSADMTSSQWIEPNRVFRRYLYIDDVRGLGLLIAQRLDDRHAPGLPCAQRAANQRHVILAQQHSV